MFQNLLSSWKKTTTTTTTTTTKFTMFGYKEFWDTLYRHNGNFDFGVKLSKRIFLYGMTSSFFFRCMTFYQKTISFVDSYQSQHHHLRKARVGRAKNVLGEHVSV